MRKIFVLLIMIILVYSATLAQSSYKTRMLKPENFQNKVTLVISDKNRSYYSLSSEEPSVINVQGPGKLRVLTRGRFGTKEIEKIQYEVLYSVDGVEQSSKKMSSDVRAKNATYTIRSMGTPGQSIAFEIVLSQGHHTVELKIADKNIEVDARYLFTPTKEKKRDWMAFCPMRPSEPVELISREESVSYYRFSGEKPLKVEIIGPTELRVLTRIENHYKMKGRVQYRVQVKEDGIVKNTYQLSSMHSEVAQYERDNELIPGKACEFIIDVPKGKHIYEVFPLDEDKKTLLGRLLLPKNDVKLVN
jgi:hypothetical protein